MALGCWRGFVVGLPVIKDWDPVLVLFVLRNRGRSTMEEHTSRDIPFDSKPADIVRESLTLEVRSWFQR